MKNFVSPQFVKTTIRELGGQKKTFSLNRTVELVPVDRLPSFSYFLGVGYAPMQ